MVDMRQALMASAPPAMALVSPTEIQPGRLVTWSEEVVRSALENEVGKNCCWGSKAWQNMEITNVEQSSSYYLKVTSFLETRDMQTKTVPYLGDAVDGPQSGQAPAVWQMQVPPPTLFK